MLKVLMKAIQGQPEQEKEKRRESQKIETREEVFPEWRVCSIMSTTVSNTAERSSNARNKTHASDLITQIQVTLLNCFKEPEEKRECI